MSERDKKLLIYLGSVLILAAAYFLVGRPYLEKYDAVTAERAQLESELAKKQEAFNKQGEYKQGIIDANNAIQAIMDEFPEDNADEKSIMFASKAEAEVPIWFTLMKFAEETQNNFQESDTQSAAEVEAENAQAAVDAVDEESEGTSEVAPQNVGETSETSATGISGLKWRDTELGLSFETQYDGFKNYLAYIRDYEDRIVIRDMDVTYSGETGIVSGSMVLSQYAILGDDRVLPDVITDVENIGTCNIFVNYNYGGSILDLLADMATDFLNLIMGGLSEEALDEFGTDYFVKVNAVTDNTNGKTVGRADDLKELTYITSSANKKEDVTFKVSGKSGEYKITYKIGKTEYTDTMTKDADGKMYLRVVSTARMSNDDKVEVGLRVINESDIPVVVNIEGDDKAKPRVSILEKAGNVTVND